MHGRACLPLGALQTNAVPERGGRVEGGGTLTIPHRFRDTLLVQGHVRLGITHLGEEVPKSHDTAQAAMEHPRGQRIAVATYLQMLFQAFRSGHETLDLQGAGFTREGGGAWHRRPRLAVDRALPAKAPTRPPHSHIGAPLLVDRLGSSTYGSYLQHF